MSCCFMLPYMHTVIVSHVKSPWEKQLLRTPYLFYDDHRSAKLVGYKTKPIANILVLFPATLRVELQGSLGCFEQQLLEILKLALYDIQFFSASCKLAFKYLIHAKFVRGHIQTHQKMLPWLRLEYVKVSPAAALVEKVHNKLQKTDIKTASRSTNLIKRPEQWRCHWLVHYGTSTGFVSNFKSI